MIKIFDSWFQSLAWSLQFLLANFLFFPAIMLGELLWHLLTNGVLMSFRQTLFYTLDGYHIGFLGMGIGMMYSKRIRAGLWSFLILCVLASAITMSTKIKLTQDLILTISLGDFLIQTSILIFAGWLFNFFYRRRNKFDILDPQPN